MANIFDKCTFWLDISLNDKSIFSVLCNRFYVEKGFLILCHLDYQDRICLSSISSLEIVNFEYYGK